MIRSSTIASIPDTWRDWLILNRDRGCEREGLIERAMAHGYERAAIEMVLASSQPVSGTESGGGVSLASVPWLQWFEAPLTQAAHQPRPGVGHTFGAGV